jgi:hypothetical protein
MTAHEPLREALVVAVAALGRVNVRCFDRAESPLKPIGDIARDALVETCRLLGDDAYDAIAQSANARDRIKDQSHGG